MATKMAHLDQDEAFDRIRRVLEAGFDTFTRDQLRKEKNLRLPEMAVLILCPNAEDYLLEDLLHKLDDRGKVLYLAGLKELECLIQGPHAARADGLTTRERQVIELVVRGYSMKAIARLLKIAPRTVAFHKYNAMEKNGLRNNAELVAFAAMHELVVVPDQGIPATFLPN